MNVLWLFLFHLAYANKLTREENWNRLATCGRRLSSPVKTAPSFKVLSGSPVYPGEYSFAVHIDYTDPRKGQCTGALISKRHILTAAHCVVREKDIRQSSRACRTKNFEEVEYNYDQPDDLKIYVGTKCPKGSCMANRKEFKAARVIPQPYYDVCNIETVATDLALIELLNDVDESEAIPICLAEEYVDIPKQIAAVGYGYDPTKKQQVFAGSQGPGLQIAVFSDYKEEDGFIAIKELGVSTCQGDSGGPLFFRGNAGYTLLGITSTGGSCDKPDPETPAKYVDVRNHFDWICRNTGICPMQ